MIPINTVCGGDDVEKAILYRPPSRSLYNFLQDNYQHAMNYVRDVGNGFIDNLKSLYNKYTSEEAIQRTKDILYSTGMHFSQDVIAPIEYNQLNNANLIMQRYMMAHPKVGDLYRRGMLHGFSETFFDREPDTYGEDRLDYGRVMDGVLQFDEEGNGFVEYFIQNDTIYDELDLTETEQFTLADMYSLVTAAISNGLDPTDPNNNLT